MKDDSDKLNQLIDECINHLADDSASIGADSLVELAHIWAKAGMTYNSFLDMRTYIINTAKDKVGCPVFIDTKVKLAEQSLQLKRMH